MSVHGANLTPAESAMLDRLIDGELNHEERRALLEQLEKEPGGWRRCALAFLEAQCWRETATGLARAARARAAAAAPADLPRRAERRGLRLPVVAALAASLLGAFGLGLAVARMAGLDAHASRGPVANVSQTATLPPRLAQSSAPAQKILEALDREVKAVAVLDVGGPAAEKLKVPLLSGPGLDERWLTSQPSAVPAYLAQQWERQGYEVVTERKLYSVDLAGGGRVSIPIDEVKLRFVGHKLN